MLVVQLAQPRAEDDLVLGARGVQVDDVVERVAAAQVAQHAHDRRDSAPGADEQELRRQRVGEGEIALGPSEPHECPRLRLADQEGGHLPLLDQLRGDADVAVRAIRVRGEGVGPPVMDAIDDDAHPQVLPRLMAHPLVAGTDHDRHRVTRLGLDPLDPPPQLAGRPQRVDELEVVVGQQRREERPHGVQGPAPNLRDLRSRTDLSHGQIVGSPPHTTRLENVCHPHVLTAPETR